MSRRRKYSDAKVRALRAWRPFKQLCRELGVNHSSGRKIRKHTYKQPSP